MTLPLAFILSFLVPLQTRPSLPFAVSPGNAVSFPLDGLHAMDVVALVRPVGAPVDDRRGEGVWSVQSFDVVASRGSIERRIKVAVPIRVSPPVRSASAFAPPPASGTYLLLAMRPTEGRLPVTYVGMGGHERKPPPELAEGTTVLAHPGELFGVALVRTDLTALPVAPTTEGTILRALALSTDADDDPTYSAYPLWNAILPYSAATWKGEEPERATKRDVVEGRLALEFYRRTLSPLLRVPPYDARGARAVGVWALRTRWGVPDAPASLTRALLGTVAAGQEADLARTDGVLNDLGNEEARARVGLSETTMLDLAVRARTSALRVFALRYVFRAPRPADQARLLPLLDDPAVRRRLMDDLANWNHRPDLAPPSKEAEYAARETELVSAWRRLIAPIGQAARGGSPE